MIGAYCFLIIYLGPWLSWLERCPDKAKVAGSNPAGPIFPVFGFQADLTIWLVLGGLAQLGERLICIQ